MTLNFGILDIGHRPSDRIYAQQFGNMNKLFSLLNDLIEVVLGISKTKKMKEVYSPETKKSKPGEGGYPSDHLLYPSYCPLGRLPSWYRRGNESSVKMNFRANRYLAHQERRIKEAVYKKQFKKATLIWFMLLKCSKTYQMCLINRTFKGWYYTLQKEQADKLVKEIMNKLRSFNLWLLLKRFYVIKNKVDSSRNGATYIGELREGEKLRPIGAPEYPSRVLSKSMTDLIYVLFWEKFARHQHGYRRNKGTFSALYGVIHMLRKNKNALVFEFDFKSFFNLVRPSWVYRILLARGQILAEVIARMLMQVEYKFKVLFEEEELKVTYKVEHEGKHLPRIVRKGLPQGLSLSPLLATLVLELFKPPKGLFMYADDGLFIGTEEGIQKFKKWLQDVELTGAEQAPDKTGIINKPRFKFLGCWIDRTAETIETPEGVILSWWVTGLKDKLKTFSPRMYQPDVEDWSWDIHPDSYLGRYGGVENLGFLTCVLVFLYSVIRSKPYKGYRFFWGVGIVDIIASSSSCLDLLCRYSKGFNLKDIKSFNKQSFITGNKFGNFETLRSTRWNPYIEAIYENWLIGYGRKKLPEFKNLFTNLF